MPLTGVLPSRDSEIRGGIMWYAKTNVILKHPANKLFLIGNTSQEPGMAREQKLRRKATVIGELKRKYEC